ncbi:MAG: DUF1292 domain-containing protein [Acetatifactor sp.]|nr:DUF1292 domain-containing protein [Acetatifactor sp.]
MSEEFMEYTTFTVKAKDGSDVELAVIAEFEFERKNYVVGARIEGDAISEEGVYIYRTRILKDDFAFDPITDPEEYEKVTKAYLELED